MPFCFMFGLPWLSMVLPPYLTVTITPPGSKLEESDTVLEITAP